MTFAKILTDLMCELKLNQLQLAELVGIRQSQVSNWVHGKSEPTYHSIKSLCLALGVEPNDLFNLYGGGE